MGTMASHRCSQARFGLEQHAAEHYMLYWMSWNLLKSGWVCTRHGSGSEQSAFLVWISIPLASLCVHRGRAAWTVYATFPGGGGGKRRSCLCAGAGAGAGASGVDGGEGVPVRLCVCTRGVRRTGWRLSPGLCWESAVWRKQPDMLRALLIANLSPPTQLAGWGSPLTLIPRQKETA